MSLKGAILSGHIPVSKFKFLFLGVPPLTIIKEGGFEEELEVAEMPDRTVHSSGQTKATELVVEIPMHHSIEQAAMEVWYAMSKDPVVPGYKRDGTLIHESVSVVGLPVVYALHGTFPKKRKVPEMDMANEGDMAVVEWTLSVDDVSLI